MELDRRTALKGAAWSLPVIALAVATPAAAASLPVCEKKTYLYTAPVNDQNNRADILIVTGQTLTVTYTKDYPSATEIKSDKIVFWKSPDSGVKAGTVKTFDLSAYGVCDPAWLQVDGNNVHYYGNGVFR